MIVFSMTSKSLAYEGMRCTFWLGLVCIAKRKEKSRTQRRGRRGRSAEGAEKKKRARPHKCGRYALPTHRIVVLLVLRVEPGFQRREIVGQGAGVQLPLPGHGFKSVRPRLALAQAEHRIQLRTSDFVPVDRAAIERSIVARRFTQSALELKLVNSRKEITHVGHVGGHVIFRARIE